MSAPDRWAGHTPLPRDLDARLESASPELRFAVVRDGDLRHRASPAVENAFEMEVLRRRHDRAPVRRLQWSYTPQRIRERVAGGPRS